MIPPDIIYEETSGDMMVPEGSSAKLICKARGFPKPKGKLPNNCDCKHLIQCSFIQNEKLRGDEKMDGK